MQKLILTIVACATIVFCHPQEQSKNQQKGGSLDDLIDQIFSHDNSGIGINTPSPDQTGQTQPNNYPSQQGQPGESGGSSYEPAQPPTPILTPGGDQQQATPILTPGGGQQQPTPILTPGGGQQQPRPILTSGGKQQPTPIEPKNPCPLGECTPYYQCANGSLITDGEGLLDIRLGQENNTNNEKHPCPGLFETCCTLVSSTIMIPPDTKVNVGCGIRNPEGVGFRITGAQDHEAEFGEFPWTVAILKEEKALDGQILNVYVCGGSLIDPGVVLTAAHCLNQKEPHILKIRAGEWDTQTKDEIFPHQDRLVRDFVIHPEYYRGGLFNDVALLFLTEPVDIAENVNTVCLPPQGEVFDGSRCFASGWGKDLFGKEGQYQVILKRVELPIVPRAHCVDKFRETRLGKHFNLHESFICAGGERGKDTCKGDGGSPLVCPIKNSPNRYAQVGIVAWGIGCGDEMPGAYVNIPLFRNWIDQQMELHQHSTLAYKL